jgi:YebC/PmpR family DNA-binding regulatory protein
MAGHSKWANIKHRKERADLKKGKIFSRVTKEIISSVKQGGADPKSNAKLKLAIQKAKMANLPNDNIERNIKKAASADQADFIEMSYELYGYGGVGLVVEIMTDNKNRISSDIRIATNKRGGTVANPGSVLFNFDQKGMLSVTGETISEDDLFLAVTEAGAEDFEVVEEGYRVITPPELLYQVKEKLDEIGAVVESAELERIPKLYIECSEEHRVANEALIEWLEALDDVDAIYHNMQD